MLWWADVSCCPDFHLFIKALETCTVSGFPPFQLLGYSNRINRTSKTLQFLTVEQCWGAALCLFDLWEPQGKMASNSWSQCHRVKTNPTPVTVFASATPLNFAHDTWSVRICVHFLYWHFSHFPRVTAFDTLQISSFIVKAMYLQM